MNSGRRFPDELLLEVFSVLPLTSLTEVSLTSRAFHRISFPFRFASFDFHPYTIHRDEGLIHPSSSELHRALQRLQFWFSDEVAPFVRSCQVTPKVVTLWPVQSTSSTVDGLRDAFFKSLPNFTGLKQIRCASLQFTQEGMTHLYQLPALTHQDIVNCHIGVEERLSCAKKLCLTRNACATVRVYCPKQKPRKIAAVDENKMPKKDVCIKIGDYSDEGANCWLPLLHPDYLQELDVVASPFRLFSGNEHKFPHVHTLVASVPVDSLSHDLQPEARFPGVQSFTIRSWRVGHGFQDVQPCSCAANEHHCPPFPILSEYIGGWSSLPIFGAQATLTRLTVWTCPSYDLTYQLQAIQVSSNISALSVSFTDFYHALPDALCAFFPRLTELRFGVVFNDDMKETFFQALADPRDLPTTLIALRWEFRYEYEQPTSPAPTLDFEQLREGLVAQCPVLTMLYIDGHHFAYGWQKTVDGRMDQRIASNVDGAKVIRENYRACENQQLH
ncbi:hypothetical protein C8R43DRAFT_1147759 [Mycena crocata]|nr:hypothetical protein C8R43DRAFT_1147759 [Mycena crocata]